MDNNRYATPAEARAAIEQLSEEDHAKLMMMAGFWLKRHEARLGRVLEPRDLLGEAFELTLNGERQWRKTVSFLRHMDQAMRSIAWAHAQRAKTAREGARELKGIGSRQDRPPPVSNVEAAALARDELAALEALFADDSVALEVLRCRAEGKEGEEVRSELRLSKTEYATVCRRIVRKLAKYALNN